ncbi:GTP-binding protein [Desulfonatronum thiosulfatophilum]|uniref:GTPase Der n=1 Tax=Desulfonatronum thiosulfatophilum TaxID=617002 RepID=A0A1G6C1X0_9BACT|nr:ribosome biogenesis GTPase Der [Desulfonatronum thiosulfatophilum]SDB26808.1 GTP-binding protein [Desulfonatronum thiosulfatophilum]
MSYELPIVALIGRPNVGKSSLFNRLLRSSKALTHDLPGVTRDRIYGEVRRGEKPHALVDTGGLEPESNEDIKQAVLSQAREALRESSLVLMVVDGREGLTTLDEQVAALLRTADKPMLLVVNKVDGAEKEDLMTAEFHQLGFTIVAVSAAHGHGLNYLRDTIIDLLPAPPEDVSTPTIAAVEPAFAEESDEDSEITSDAEMENVATGLRLALLGRPNVGKSSLVNALIGYHRVIVSSEAGTTRDSVDVSWQAGPKRYTLVDTAGVRKRTRIQDSLERFSVLKSLRSSKKAQVTLLVLDAVDGLTGQDKKLLSFLDREKTPLIAVVNKIDLVPRNQLNALKKTFQEELSFAGHIPLMFTSTITRAGLGGLLPLTERVWDQCQTRISTGQLNRILGEATQRHQPAVVNRRRAKFFYVTQTDIAPPTFVFFVNDPELVKPEYSRYLENQIRKRFSLNLTPVQLYFRSSHENSKK